MALGKILPTQSNVNVIFTQVQSGGNNKGTITLTHNGTTYTESTTFSVAQGDIIHVKYGYSDVLGSYGRIRVNGAEVVSSATTANNSYYTYDYDLTVASSSDITISFLYTAQTGVAYSARYNCDINFTPGGLLSGIITKGKTMINGISYDITQGKTLVNGVAYDMTGNIPIPVTITKPSGYSGAYCIIDGTTYRDATTGIEVLAGDIIKLYCRGATRNNVSIRGSITINNVVVAYIDGYGETHYDWTVPSGTKTITIALTYTSGTNQGNVIVTTT